MQRRLCICLLVPPRSRDIVVILPNTFCYSEHNFTWMTVNCPPLNIYSCMYLFTIVWLTWNLIPEFPTPLGNPCPPNHVLTYEYIFTSADSISSSYEEDFSIFLFAFSIGPILVSIFEMSDISYWSSSPLSTHFQIHFQLTHFSQISNIPYKRNAKLIQSALYVNHYSEASLSARKVSIEQCSQTKPLV